MAETLSVKAILSAADQGFTSMMNSARKTVSKLGGTVKSGIGFGILTGAGMAAFSALSNGARSLITEIDTANATWKTFGDNMSYIGKSGKEIAKVKGELQSFAQKTVFSSSDMASTYSQLEAVGVGAMKSLKNGTTGVVKGFGGLAAAAENPQQAMKTLSMQATQMAGRPKVAWQDFKLMLEQTPAGIAAVAKEMGMTTQELVGAVQDGKVKTEDFFAAIEAAGNSKAFIKMATEAKTVGQAMDGLRETLGNKLGPAFDVLTQAGIKAINSISDRVASLNAEGLADKLSAGLKAATPYINMAKSALLFLGSALKTVGSFLLDHSKAISRTIPVVLALAAAYKAFKIVSAVVPALAGFANQLAKMATGGVSTLGSKLMKTASGVETVGKASQVSAKRMLAGAKSFLMLGAAVLLIAAGFGIMAYSAIQLADAGGAAIGVMAGLTAALVGLGIGMSVMLKSISKVGPQAIPAATAMMALGAAVVLVAAGFAILAFASTQIANAGGLAIGVMAGMVVALAALMVLAAALGPALTAGSIGFIAFGAAILLVGAGALLAAAALSIVAGVLPTVVQYGFQGAAAIALLGAGMIVFAVGAAAAGIACVVLAAGLALVGVGSVAAAAGILALSAAVLVLAAGAVALGSGLLICAGSIVTMAAALPVAAVGATMMAAAFTMMLATCAALSALFIALAASITAFGVAATASAAGIIAFGTGVLTATGSTLAMGAALLGVSSKMKSIAGSAKAALNSFVTMQSAAVATGSSLNTLGSTAQSAMNRVVSALTLAASQAPGLGQRLGSGFTNGMRSGLSPAPSVASAAVNSVTSAFRSGYGAAYSAGAYIGQGLVNGLRSMLGAVRSIANQIAAEADRAIKARAKIGSPSKITTKYGRWFGEGFVIGMKDMARKTANAAKELVSFPILNRMSPAVVFGGELSADYDYYRKAEFVIDVPLTVDGKEFARATASYTEDELNKRQTRSNRKRGKV
jgi:tape measure domain-containing protein